MATSGSRGTDLARLRTSEILATLARPLRIVPDIIHLRAENTYLRAENARLMIRSGQAEEAARENERLRSLLEFQHRSELTLRAAKVIATDPMPSVHSLLVDVGQRQGAAKHMPVINDQGLVGKLVRVGDGTSIVQLLLDRNLGASVRLAHCRADGITAWKGGNRLLIEEIPASAGVRAGEEVLTSGLDGVFPADIPVGQIVRTEKIEESLFLQVEMRPHVDISRLEEVFIILVDSSSRPSQ
jgi:rod shape-determining protein MreC